MDRKEIYSRVDHTLLGQDATWSQIKEICDDAMAYGTASVCIPHLCKARKGIRGGQDGGMHGHWFSQWL